MTVKWQRAALLVAAAFLLGWLLSHSTSANDDVIREKEIVNTRFDTVHSVAQVPLRPLHAEAPTNHSKTIMLHDTIYREACLDTLIAGDTTAIAPDTLSVCYARDTFSLALGLAARRKNIAVPYVAHDTFYWRDNEEQFRENKQPWYDAVLVVILSLVAGIIVGKL
jgi:hypothetical protein